MKRFTLRDVDGTASILLDESSEWTVARNANRQYTITGDAIDRLAAYEDTGLEPRDIISAVDMAKIACALHELNAYKDLGSIEHLRELIQAEQDGRLVVLDEPRKPLIWGDDDHDSILCPRCGHDLMGGFPEGDSCEVPMYQCPYCGQPIDGTKALAGKGVAHEADSI